ncbi:hypothetical protein BDZ89DRAFT_1135236 [Hymenopellis radicata]|nr:hypothetical protein BDZ89DRAFT_1135236 [Hymenopellis radicata]
MLVIIGPAPQQQAASFPGHGHGDRLYQPVHRPQTTSKRASSRSGSKKLYPLDTPGAPRTYGNGDANSCPDHYCHHNLHLVSYYTSEDIRSGKLMRPCCRADIMSAYASAYLPIDQFSRTSQNRNWPRRKATICDGA